jgi:hypothetical protein
MRLFGLFMSLVGAAIAISHCPTDVASAEFLAGEVLFGLGLGTTIFGRRR